MRSPREHIDFGIYLRAFGVFARNPTVIVLPLLVGVIGVLVARVSGYAGGGILASVLSFLVLLLQLFGLGVSIIIADAGWRRGNASFDDAWQDARRKGGDILFAAFGFTFVVSIAQYASSIIGGLGIVLMALAVYALIYTVPAAAIGGIPGSAAITVSIERVKGAPMTAAILTVVGVIASGPSLLGFDPFVVWLIGAAAIGSPLVAMLLNAVVGSILFGYLAIVLAKVYSDVSFTMPRW